MRIGFFGDGRWSHEALRSIQEIAKFEILFVCPRWNQPDPELVKIASDLGLAVLSSENVNTDVSLLKLASQCDLLVSMSFNQIFKKGLIECTKGGILNCHAGKLPFYRGRNILNWVLINDESSFGITVHFVDEGIDTGDIVLQEEFSIDDKSTYASLLEEAYHHCPRLLVEALLRLQDGDVVTIKQDSIHPTGTYFPRRVAGDEVICWDQTSRSVFNFVRALVPPGPAALTFWNGQSVKVLEIDFDPEFPRHQSVCGCVLLANDDFFVVKTADTCVRVTEWKADFLIKTGMRLTGVPG